MTKTAKLVYVWTGWVLAAYVAWTRTESADILIGMVGIGLIFGFLASLDIIREVESGLQ